MTRLTPLRAIRAKCLDCCAGQVAEVRRCELANCPLYPYRFGKRQRQSTDTTPGQFARKSPQKQGVFHGREGV